VEDVRMYCDITVMMVGVEVAKYELIGGYLREVLERFGHENHS